MVIVFDWLAEVLHRTKASGPGRLPSDERIAFYRDYVHDSVVLAAAAQPEDPLPGLSWQYFREDVRHEARAARIVMRDGTFGTFFDTIRLLPPIAIVRLMAARSLYFPTPENDGAVDDLLAYLDAATVRLMRQRRNAVLAQQAAEAKRAEAEAPARAREEAMWAEYRTCPFARLSTEPAEFLRWIKLQTPDTWNVVVDRWDYNGLGREDVIAWILDQPDCDLATAAQFFFIAAMDLGDSEPETLSPLYRNSWELMARVGHNWQRGHYRRNDLRLSSVVPSEIALYDEIVARREAEGRPFPWRVPGPGERRFGVREPDSDYLYEHGHLWIGFGTWKRGREARGCGVDFPRCCNASPAD